ncbi:MAG TPA: hypothetical protein VII99_11790, partial [Bacteroidia bacterium]
SQPITSLLKALQNLFGKHEDIAQVLKFKIVGRVSPSHISEIKARVPELNVEVIEYVPHLQAIQQMLNADLLLNSLAETENSALLISGKLMEYIASGNPVLCLGNPQGDAAHLLHNFNNAAVIARKDIDLICAFIEKQFEQWKNGAPQKTDQTIQQYSRRVTAKQLAELIQSTIAKK